VVGAHSSATFVEADPEPGLGVVAMCFAWWRNAAHQVGGGATGLGHGDGDNAQQKGQLGGDCQARILTVEAARFGVAEQTLDGPSFPVSLDGAGARLGTGDDV